MTFPYQPATMLAPMEGITNPVVRDLLSKRGGVGVVCTEFIRISQQVVGDKVLKRDLVKSPHCALSVQVMGRDAQLMGDSAERVERAGADIVDINLGCPTTRAAKGGVGAAMLKDPKLLHQVLSAMRKNTKGYLSAKIRAGFDENDHVITIAKTVQDAGADFITVHPRRRKDQYQGVADWRIIARIKAALTIPVIGNGDIWYAKDAQRMIDETDCDAIMIGRGALRNPWLFQQIQQCQDNIKPIQPDGNAILAFVDELRHILSDTAISPHEAALLGRLKEWVGWITRSLDDQNTFRKTLLRCADLNTFTTMLQDHLSPLGPEAFDLQADGHLKLMASGVGEF